MNRLIIQAWELHQSVNYPSLYIIRVGELSASVNYSISWNVQKTRIAEPTANCIAYLTIQFETIWIFQSIYPFTVFAEWKPRREHCSGQNNTCSALASFFLQFFVTSTFHIVRSSLLYCHLIKLTYFSSSLNSSCCLATHTTSDVESLNFSLHCLLCRNTNSNCACSHCCAIDLS